MKKKHKKAAVGLMTTGIGLGVMTSVHGTNYGLSRAMKPMGTMIGAGMVMDSLNGLQNVMPGQKKRKKKR